MVKTGRLISERSALLETSGKSSTDMAHRIHIDVELGCVFACFYDRVDMVELDEVRQEVEASLDFRPGLNRLWDERDCVIDVTADELGQLAERWASSDHLHGPRKLAYLIRRDVAWGFNRVFEARREQPGVEVSFELFTDYAEAKAWLGLPMNLPDPRQLVTANGE